MSKEKIDEERKRFSSFVEIGYLSGSFEQGDVPEGFISKLTSVQETADHVLTMGHHTCEYCFPEGDQDMLARIEKGDFCLQEITKEVWSSGDYHTEKYTWPDMLKHYIAIHKYLPPQDFIEAIMNYQSRSKTPIPKIKLLDFSF